MSAKILLSVVALGGVGLAALPADLLSKPTNEPVALRLDKQVASLSSPVIRAPAQPSGVTDPTRTGSIGTTPPAAPFPPPNAQLATVGDSNLNARQGPATSFAKVFVVSAGEKLVVLNKDGTWVRVRRNTGESGWVHSSYLQGGDRADKPENRVATAQPPRRVDADDPPPASKRATLGAGSVLFSSPSRSSQPIFRVRAGERLRIGERRGNWVRVVTSQGFSGWLLVR